MIYKYQNNKSIFIKLSLYFILSFIIIFSFFYIISNIVSKKSNLLEYEVYALNENNNGVNQPGKEISEEERRRINRLEPVSYMKPLDPNDKVKPANPKIVYKFSLKNIIFIIPDDEDFEKLKLTYTPKGENEQQEIFIVRKYSPYWSKFSLYKDNTYVGIKSFEIPKDDINLDLPVKVVAIDQNANESETVVMGKEFDDRKTPPKLYIDSENNLHITPPSKEEMKENEDIAMDYSIFFNFEPSDELLELIGATRQDLIYNGAENLEDGYAYLSYRCAFPQFCDPESGTCHPAWWDFSPFSGMEYSDKGKILPPFDKFFDMDTENGHLKIFKSAIKDNTLVRARVHDSGWADSVVNKINFVIKEDPKSEENNQANPDNQANTATKSDANINHTNNTTGTTNAGTTNAGTTNADTTNADTTSSSNTSSNTSSSTITTSNTSTESTSTASTSTTGTSTESTSTTGTSTSTGTTTNNTTSTANTTTVFTSNNNTYNNSYSNSYSSTNQVVASNKLKSSENNIQALNSSNSDTKENQSLQNKNISTKSSQKENQSLANPNKKNQVVPKTYDKNNSLILFFVLSFLVSSISLVSILKKY